MATVGLAIASPLLTSRSREAAVRNSHSFSNLSSQLISQAPQKSLLLEWPSRRCDFAISCLPPTAEIVPVDPTRLFVSGLSFHTTKQNLKTAFRHYGKLVEVNLVMDKIANRPKGYAFLKYSTEEESKKAVEGMHGKFLDGRVIFVEVSKPKSEVRRRGNLSKIQISRSK